MAARAWRLDSSTAEPQFAALV